MAAYPIDHDKYWLLAFKHGLETYPQIAKASGVSEKTVWKALQGRPVRRDTRVKLAKAVGLKDDRKILAPLGAGKQAVAGARGEQTTVLDSAALQRRKLQDVKMVLGSTALSKSLITGKRLPSFAECMSHSHVWTPIDDRHKDHPFIPGTKFNHFVQLALLVSLDLENEPNVLCYRRAPRPQVPSQVHTVGQSILFGCSTSAHVDRRKQQKTLLDLWLDEISDPEAAARSLLAGERPVVLQLAERKIDLLGHKCRISPFGVITRDERPESFNRVYTQFVFQVMLSVTAKDIDRFVGRIAAHGTELSRLPKAFDPEKVFVSNKGRLNAMDIVAWQALHSSDVELRFNTTRFWRGFKVV